MYLQHSVNVDLVFSTALMKKSQCHPPKKQKAHKAANLIFKLDTVVGLYLILLQMPRKMIKEFISKEDMCVRKSFPSRTLG